MQYSASVEDKTTNRKVSTPQLHAAPPLSVLLDDRPGVLLERVVVNLLNLDVFRLSSIDGESSCRRHRYPLWMLTDTGDKCSSRADHRPIHADLGAGCRRRGRRILADGQHGYCICRPCLSTPKAGSDDGGSWILCQ